MPPRKRSAKSSAEAPSSKKPRDDRARQRAAVREQAQREQGLRDEARGDQELLDGTVRNMAIAAKGLHQKDLLRKITEFNTASSPFLRLPAELRNIVYDYVFKGARYMFDENGFNGCWYDGEKPCCLATYQYHHLGLFLASSQLHAETSLLLYKLSVFEFDLDVTEKCWYMGFKPEFWYEYCVGERAFLRGIPAKQIKAIAKIEVTTRCAGDIAAKKTRTGGEWSEKLLGW